MTKGGHQVHVPFGLCSLTYKAEEWTGVRMDGVGLDLESLEGFLVQDINWIALIDEGLGHYEVRNDDGDNHRVVLVDRVDALEVPVREGDRRETSL